MNILITGGNGFIGTRLVNVLSKKGHKITLIDPIVRENIGPNINQINCDFREVNKFINALKDTELVLESISRYIHGFWTDPLDFEIDIILKQTKMKKNTK